MDQNEIKQNFLELETFKDLRFLSHDKSQTKTISNIFKNFYFKLIFLLFRPILKRQILVNNKSIIILKELDNRLKVLENKTPSAFPKELNYKEFEDGFRGPEENIKNKQKLYLEYFNNCKSVTDIGCGRGEFLDLLRENNIVGLGIDSDPEMVSRCLEKGLKVKCIDALEYVSDKESRELIENAFISMLVEHVNYDYLYNLLKNIYLKMKEDSILVVETLNPNSFYAFKKCFLVDPTHIKMIYPETIKYFLEKIGYKNIQINYITPVPDTERITAFKEINIRDAYIKNILEVMNNNINLIDNSINGFIEYFVVAYK